MPEKYEGKYKGTEYTIESYFGSEDWYQGEIVLSLPIGKFHLSWEKEEDDDLKISSSYYHFPTDSIDKSLLAHLRNKIRSTFINS